MQMVVMHIVFFLKIQGHCVLFYCLSLIPDFLPIKCSLCRPPAGTGKAPYEIRKGKEYDHYNGKISCMCNEVSNGYRVPNLESG